MVIGRIKDCLLLLREILKARQPGVVYFAERISGVFHQLKMFSAAYFVHSLCRHLGDMKLIVDNLVFRQRNDLLCGV